MYVSFTAKEERQLYTLNPIANTAVAAPPPVSNAPAIPAPPPILNAPAVSALPPISNVPAVSEASKRPPASRPVGAIRTQRKSTQARMQTGPMPPGLKARILENMAANKASRASRVQPNATPATIPPIEAESVGPTIPAQSNQSVLVSDPLGTQQSPPEDDGSDSISYTSTLPDVFDVGLDDSAPLATGPWVITDHLTGEMIVYEEDPPATHIVPDAPSDPTIQTLPILGILTLIQTPPPTLLFEDQDERPEWLMRSVREFLQHAPYYLCLSEVVDLFLAQEARLNYPSKVNESHFPPCLRLLTTSFTTRLLAMPYRLKIGLPKLPRI